MRIVLGAVVMALVLADPAGAATVSAQGASARFTAGAGEDNDVRVGADGGRLTVRDAGAPLAAGAGCAAAPAGAVTCELADPTPSLAVALGDGDDRLAIGDAPDWAVTGAGGAGDDVLAGGPSDDVLTGGPGDDVLRGAAGEDRLDGGRGADRLLPGASGVREDRVRCGRGRDAVTLTPRLDAPLLRPECERITAGVLRAVRWSFAIVLRMTVRAAPDQRSCRVTIRGPGSTAELGLLRRGTSDVRFVTTAQRAELRVEPSARCGAGGAFALRLARRR